MSLKTQSMLVCGLAAAMMLVFRLTHAELAWGIMLFEFFALAFGVYVSLDYPDTETAHKWAWKLGIVACGLAIVSPLFPGYHWMTALQDKYLNYGLTVVMWFAISLGLCTWSKMRSESISDVNAKQRRLFLDSLSSETHTYTLESDPHESDDGEPTAYSKRLIE